MAGAHLTVTQGAGSARPSVAVVIRPEMASTMVGHCRRRRCGWGWRQILELIAKGLSNAEAARALGLSSGTVRTHLEHIYAKLEVSNRTEAVTQGIRRGLIEP